MIGFQECLERTANKGVVANRNRQLIASNWANNFHWAPEKFADQRVQRLRAAPIPCGLQSAGPAGALPAGTGI